MRHPVDAIGNDAVPVGVDLPVEQLRPGFEQFLRNAPPALGEVVALAPSGPVDLRLIRTIMVTHAAINGPAAFAWVDQ